MLEIEGEGKLGIVFERNSSPPQITRISADGLAGGHPQLRPGLLLHSVQGAVRATLLPLLSLSLSLSLSPPRPKVLAKCRRVYSRLPGWTIRR